MKLGEVSLRFADETFAKVAAAFVAELVRQQVTFTAREDIGRHPGGGATETVLYLEFTGGF